MKETIAQKALRLLEPIPEDRFMKGEFTDNMNSCCSVGHFNRLTSRNPEDYSNNNCFMSTDGMSLYKASATYLNILIAPIVQVNDGYISKYSEDTPKARVIHLLQDMIEAGY